MRGALEAQGGCSHLRRMPNQALTACAQVEVDEGAAAAERELNERERAELGASLGDNPDGGAQASRARQKHVAA